MLKSSGKLKGKQRLFLGEGTDQDGRGALRHLVVSVSEGEDAEYQAGRDDGFDQQSQRNGAWQNPISVQPFECSPGFCLEGKRKRRFSYRQERSGPCQKRR